MRTENLLFSAVQFLFVMMIIALGIVLLGLHHSLALRCQLAWLVLRASPYMGLLGWGTLGCGGVLLCLFYSMHKGSYYQLKMGAQVEEELLLQVVRRYWKGLVQESAVHVRWVRNQRMELTLEIPMRLMEQQEALLPQVEQELGEILRTQLGYERPFTVQLLFR